MCNRKTLVIWLGIAVLASICQPTLGEKPNIVFIFADDQCFETIAALGHPQISTPNLDRLVRRGLTFTRTYNMGSWSGAVCVASRTMLNTGRYLWHAHRVSSDLAAERQAGRFWSDQMQAAGYRTYMTGKWHVKTSPKDAFDVSGTIRAGMPKDYPEGYNRPLIGTPDVWSPSDPKWGGFWEGGTHWSEVVANEATGFLKEAAQRSEPFFMYLAFNAPHDPRQSPQSFVDRYPAESVFIPTNYLSEYPFKDAIGCGVGLRDERLGPFPRTEYAVQVNRREYYALITHMDEQIGRILDSIQATGKQDSTYIFFSADHGLAVGHHGLFGKQNMYDHSVRVPLMIVGPEIPANQQVRDPVYLQDIMATTLELAGVPEADHIQFQSLMPYVRGEGDSVKRDAIYGAYLELQRMIAMDGYKLILYPKIKRARLYQTAVDPDEMIDLAGDERYRDVISHLLRRLFELQIETGDTLDLKQPFAEWL